jgi:hypothetical protein
MRRNSEKDKKLADDERLLRAWRNWHRERLDEAMAGPHGVVVVQVVEFLKTMSPASANALLALMRSQVWADVDADTRFELLHLINSTITRLREKNGMPPIDDPLPDSRRTCSCWSRNICFPQGRATPEAFPASHETKGVNHDK